jgi:hypothetical protein
MIKKQLTPLSQLKPYNPVPHPMQHRIAEFRALPSLVTGRRHEST